MPWTTPELRPYFTFILSSKEVHTHEVVNIFLILLKLELKIRVDMALITSSGIYN